MQPPFNALRDEVEGVNDPPDMIQQQQQGGQCCEAARMIPAQMFAQIMQQMTEV
jgi:hypothetical protein